MIAKKGLVRKFSYSGFEDSIYHRRSWYKPYILDIFSNPVILQEGGVNKLVLKKLAKTSLFGDFAKTAFGNNLF